MQLWDFKEKGKDALLSGKGNAPYSLLAKIQSFLHTVMLSMDQKIDRLGSAGGRTACCQRASRMYFGSGWKRGEKAHGNAIRTGIIFKRRKC